MEGNQPIVIPNNEGKRTTPSVVAFLENGERKVGDPAKRQAIINPTRTVYSIKRFMGRSYDEVTNEIARVPFKVVRGENNIPKVDIDGHTYSPQEISAIILQKNETNCRRLFGNSGVTDAIITVPAYLMMHSVKQQKKQEKLPG
jgi:molecular chaperone DnaK